MRNDKGWWLGLILLFLIFSVYHIVMQDMKWAVKLGDFYRHVVKFGVALLVFILGTFFLKKNAAPTAWMWQLWNWVHIVGMVVIVLIGSFHHWVMPIGTGVKYFASRIHLFLISPLFYAGMGILSRQLNALEGELNKK